MNRLRNTLVAEMNATRDLLVEAGINNLNGPYVRIEGKANPALKDQTNVHPQSSEG